MRPIILCARADSFRVEQLQHAGEVPFGNDVGWQSIADGKQFDYGEGAGAGA